MTAIVVFSYLTKMVNELFVDRTLNVVSLYRENQA